MPNLTVFAENAVLPNEEHPVSAKVTVDLDSGKVISVDCDIALASTSANDENVVLRLDPRQILLPGLIE